MKSNKFKIQEAQYRFPYHYLVEFDDYSNGKSLAWGLEYYSYMKHTLEYIQNMEYTSLLDIGCGDGKLICELARKKPNQLFFGVDLSPAAIFLAKGLTYDLKNARFETKDISSVNERFGIVVLNEVIEHISSKHIPEFIKQVENTMAEGGRLIVTVPSQNVPLNKKHYRHYDINMLKKSFKGLTFIESKYIFKYSNFGKLFYEFFRRINCKKIELYLAEKFLFKASKKNGSHIFAVFKKARNNEKD